jgi:hypothetical protein
MSGLLGTMFDQNGNLITPPSPADPTNLTGSSGLGTTGEAAGAATSQGVKQAAAATQNFLNDPLGTLFGNSNATVFSEWATRAGVGLLGLVLVLVAVAALMLREA